MSDIFKSSITEDDIKHMLAYLDKHNLCVAADGDHINAQDISVTKKQFKDIVKEMVQEMMKNDI